ncbi:26S proteasome non-ATPase regulatory subunit 7 A [Phytophthora cactorum]|uniref:26S proteasome non-ATPase regulatory subunit 7 A n=1 Tax=Phytophthora cactorum TaxID=29920 RepID=A0A8T1II61_9STRA|nr:26S proteasome non-ATPase regulatory subunit 7 A [Phytophthora cactorum]KAG2833539.1 26S proteasome non-ATPase regulatory subunit 7 A [Phytophthora cactorum]KAG2912121.1 26S proteasome non-ATPase regulatory subunit 7 A [Phytophthora cactorum]KAG2926896.1 26S proteasome non-ATPase regulatory subunit 7 A [Phytophthora cactorum]KAG2944997.1 26S proteasome non-ATPase regulatory subunit 7 A [Phytophthora cactorum]
MAETTTTTRGLPEEVVTHPLVLLSIVDHYNRVARDTSKRVVGVLLGSTFHGKCDITNSFAVPFDEDLRNPGIWYLDHDFLENMYQMFKKINAKERIVGFYSSGPKIRKADLDIDDLFRRYCPNPVLVICDVRPNVEGLPTTAYGSIEEVEEDGKAIKRVFKHIKSTVGAYEAEEVKHKMTALNGLKERLEEMKTYLENVVAGRLPPNHQIIYNMQTIFNLLPNLNIDELVRSMFMKTNDMHFVIYLSSLIRCTIALHNLVNNKIKYKESEEVGFTDKKEEKKEAASDKAAKDKTSEKAP